MKHALLRVDVHSKVAQKIEPQQPRDFGIGHCVVNCSRQVTDFHAAHRNGLQTRYWRLDHAIGGLEGKRLGIGADVDGEIARQRWK